MGFLLRTADNKYLIKLLTYHYCLECFIQNRWGSKDRSLLDDFLDDRHKNSRRHMRSGKFLITASKNFASRKVEMVSIFSLTILFAEYFYQIAEFLQPPSNSSFKSKSSFSHTREEIKPKEAQAVY